MSLLKQRGRELERFDGLSLIYWYVRREPSIEYLEESNLIKN